MNITAPRVLAGTPQPTVSIARDIVRIVVTAIVAGTAFALLLALAVLSLTVIAPPAQASGAPVVTESEIGPGTGGDVKAPMKTDVAPLQLAAAPAVAQAKPIDPALDTVHERAFEAQKPATPTALYLVLALVAGFLAFFVYSLARRKS